MIRDLFLDLDDTLLDFGEAERHGIILAKNEPAKRCGVKTAETIWKAKQKCPGPHGGDARALQPHQSAAVGAL